MAFKTIRSFAVGLILMICVAAGASAHEPNTASAQHPQVLRGRIVATDQSAVEIEDMHGRITRLAVSPATVVLSDAEDFSVATMSDITLGVRDLSRGDAVEIVLDPKAARTSAGIITRISPIEPTATACATNP